MTIPQTAAALGIAPSTAIADWSYAKGWLKLEISKNDTLGPWALIADQLKNNGSYQWVIPDTLASQQPCRIKFVVYSNGNSKAGYSNGFFIGPEPVPVELTAFKANLIDNKVQLSWTTATETNNKGFEIYRSQKTEIRSQNWEKIGFVNGNGTTSQPHSYSFADNESLSGTYQYRFKQIDFDGNFKYSKVIEISVNNPAFFSLSQNYPNPFNPTTVIKYSIPDVISTPTGRGRNLNVTLKVYDILGREVVTLVNEAKQPGNYEAEFNGSKYPSGIYFYELTAGNKNDIKKMLLLK